MIETIKNPQGQLSSMRIIFVLVSIIIFCTWSWISIVHTKLMPLPEDIQVILGIVFGGKVLQTFNGK